MAPDIISLGNVAAVRLPDLIPVESQPRPMSNDETSFARLVAQAVHSLEGLQAEADAAALDFLAGGSTEIHDVLIAMEKATLGFQLTLQLRNKVIEAYQEIMRMQV